MTFPPCQLCESAPASCRSHIIPKQFFHRMRGDAKHLYSLEVKETIDRDYTQSGIWEQRILCPECDHRLGHFDEYAYSVLPGVLDKQRIQTLRKDLQVYELGAIDAEKFRLFAIALVWRAARSTHRLFQRLKQLGPYEGRFREVLRGGNREALNDVDCLAMHFMPPHFDKIMLPPYPTKLEGINVVQFYLYPWKLVVKLDKRPFTSTFHVTSLKTGAPTYALMLDSFSAGERLVLADLQKKIQAYPD